jgi:hypothetical protein
MRALLVVLVALALPASAGAAGSGQDFEGSWEPPPAASVGNYRVTVIDEGEQFVGRITGGVIICEGAPDGDNEPFWIAKQSGSLNGGAIYEGTTYLFNYDSNGENCVASQAPATFWPLVNDRLRVCPNQQMDTTSPVDESENCVDFRRTDDPLEVKPHVAKDYIPKITRDDNSCKTDYNVYLRFVDDDPMNSVKIFLKRGGGSFKRFPNNELFLPLKNDANQTRVLDFRWVKKGPLTLRVKIRTQSGKTFKRQKAFAACSD